MNLDDRQSLPESFWITATKCSNQVVYRRAIVQDPANPFSPRRWQSVTYAEVGARVGRIRDYLFSVGVRRGDRVAIISSTRPEWMEADLAILSLGAIVVSVYPSLTAEEVAYLLFDAGVGVAFAENEEQAAKLRDLATRECLIPGTEDRPPTTTRLELRHIVTFEEVSPGPITTDLKTLLSGNFPAAPGEFDATLSRESLACLVYTSGTTGPPKGVAQTHGNHLANVRQVVESGLVREDSHLLLVLPLAHSFAKLMAYIGFLTPATLSFPAIVDRRSSRLNPAAVTKDIREANAGIIPLVPRFLEKMQSGILEKTHGVGLSALLLRLTIRLAKQRQLLGRLSPIETLLWSATAGVRRRVKRALFGNSFEFVVSGGAKLGPDTNRFFDGMQIEVLEGYGLTETCVATNINRRGQKKIGTVGPVLASDIELQFGPDGEILFRGPNITRGYYNRPSATKIAWDGDGWFHTGDLGSIDSDGFLSVTGRKKELLVTSYGKKVAPSEIEEKVKTHPLVSQAILVGDGKSYCSVLLTLDQLVLRDWKARGQAQDEAAIKSVIEGHIEEVNKSLASYESIKRFAFLPEEPSIENGLMTPTFKVKRQVIVSRYKDLIESLYE